MGTWEIRDKSFWKEERVVSHNENHQWVSESFHGCGDDEIQDDCGMNTFSRVGKKFSHRVKARRERICSVSPLCSCRVTLRPLSWVHRPYQQVRVAVELGQQNPERRLQGRKAGWGCVSPTSSHSCIYSGRGCTSLPLPLGSQALSVAAALLASPAMLYRSLCSTTACPGPL